MAEPIHRILPLLQGARKTHSGWNARCPAHDDRQASLSISEGGEGRVLLKCFAGCKAEEIMSALGLGMRDLFSSKGEGGPSSSLKRVEHSNAHAKSCANKASFTVRQEVNCSNHAGLTLEVYAEAKRIPLQILRSFGPSQIYFDKSPVLRIPYRDSTGIEVAVRFRTAMDGPDHFRWRSGDKPCLYGLDRLSAAKARGFVLLVEGESDCHTLWACHIPALGLPGADCWKEPWANHLEGIPLIYVVIEPGRGGERLKEWLSKSRIRNRCKILTLEPHKDPSALYLACQADFIAFQERLREYMAEAIPWKDIERKAKEENLSEAYRASSHLIEDAQLIERIREAIACQGYAGDTRPPLLAYIAVTSRLLERPLNLAFVAPSAAGKNKAVDAALELMPPEAFFVEKAGSARALIYNEEDFEHRTVVVSEADSIPEDGPAASAIRSLAADNCMEYDVTERDERTARFITRRIKKPGPTGLITTSTRSLGEQMGTRLLDVSIRDDEEQTRAVMRIQAKRVKTHRHEGMDLAPFHALQRFLQNSSVKSIVIPFAEVLSDMVPAKMVRMRRDFPQLLTCIQAVALLYQVQRRAISEGCIEATLQDYALARDLLSPIFNAIEAGGITPAIRETVEALLPGEDLSEGELADRLNLAKSTVSYRVRRAIKGGWIKNSETRKGHPARLSRGDPLPDECTALPTTEELERRVSQCSDGIRQEAYPLPPSYEEPEILGIKR